MISIISIINDDSVAREFLLRGLSHQNTKYDLILVNNKDSSYRSAAEAYNKGSAYAKGDYLMFIHQDVYLPYPNWLEEIENSLSTVSNLGVAGIAGMLQPSFMNDFDISARYYLLKRFNLIKIWYSKYARGNIFHGREKRPWLGEFTSEILSIKTLDELLLIIPASFFEFFKFDEKTCDNWHLYGVDYSLTASQKHRDVCILPHPVVHLSIGNLNDEYFKTLVKLTKKHQEEKIINTVIAPWSTRLQMTKWQINHFFPNQRLASDSNL
jgi:glycosyltransferase involved in cell wall biosynthesis